jgi:hypothetical protein
VRSNLSIHPFPPNACCVLNGRRDVDILLFPVKLGGWLSAVAAVAGFGTTSCGYRSEQVVAAAEPLCVRGAPPKIPDLAAVEAVLDGARAELTERGALGSSYPCLIVEVLRVDEVGTGAVAPSAGDQPFARGTTVAVTARAWVESSAGAAPSRDTGDVRRAARGAAVRAGSADSIRHADELRAASDRLGHALAARALGLPEAADEAP